MVVLQQCVDRMPVYLWAHFSFANVTFFGLALRDVVGSKLGRAIAVAFCRFTLHHIGELRFFKYCVGHYTQPQHIRIP